MARKLTMWCCRIKPVEVDMHELIYLIGLIVVVMFVLGALGLR